MSLPAADQFRQFRPPFPRAGSARPSIQYLLLCLLLNGVGHVRAVLGELRTHRSLFETCKSLLQRKWFYVWFFSFYLMMLFGLPETPAGYGLMILALRMIRLDGQELGVVMYGGGPEESAQPYRQALASVLSRLAFSFLSLFLAFESNAAGVGGILLGLLLIDPLFRASRRSGKQKTQLLALPVPESSPTDRGPSVRKRRTERRRAKIFSERISRELQSKVAEDESTELQQSPAPDTAPERPSTEDLEMRIPTPDTVRHESGETSPDTGRDELQITPATSFEQLEHSTTDYQSLRSRSISPTPGARSRSQSPGSTTENLLASEGFTLLELHLEDWVVLHDGREGIVRFLGSRMSSATEWIGIELIPDISVNGPLFTDEANSGDVTRHSDGDNRLIVRPSAIASVLHPQPPAAAPKPRNSVMSVQTTRTLASIVEERGSEAEAEDTRVVEYDSGDDSDSESDSGSEREGHVARPDHPFWSGRLAAPNYGHAGDAANIRHSQRTDGSRAPTLFDVPQMDAGQFEAGHFSRRGSEDDGEGEVEASEIQRAEEINVRVSICEGDTDDFEARMGMLVDGLDDMLAGTSGWSEVGMIQEHLAAQEQALVHPALRKTWTAAVPTVRMGPGNAEDRCPGSRGTIMGTTNNVYEDTPKSPTKKISRKVRVVWRGLTKGKVSHAGPEDGMVGAP